MIAHDCMRSIIYFRELGEIEGKPDALIYTKDVFSEHAVNSWCKLFGSRSEDTHWSKLAENEEVVAIVDAFTKERILEAAETSDEEWIRYHERMKKCRDEFFAHFDLNGYEIIYPNLTLALCSVLELRSWLSNILNTAIENGQSLRNAAISNEGAIKQFIQETAVFKIST